MRERTFSIFQSRADYQRGTPAVALRCDHIDQYDVCAAISSNDIRIVGKLANSSNGALLGEIEHSNAVFTVVVKPSMYENPLLDFPWGSLAKREVAAFEVSQLLGWNIVPPTVLRDVNDMECSVQLFIVHNPRQHYFNLFSRHPLRMEQVAVFDYITNNADRKAGHILCERSNSFDLILEEDGEPADSDIGFLWGIDHGLTFHTDDKLRTVIWEFSERKITESILGDIAKMYTKMSEALTPFLSRFEVEKTLERVANLLINPYHRAYDEQARSIPWPLV